MRPDRDEGQKDRGHDRPDKMFTCVHLSLRGTDPVQRFCCSLCGRPIRYGPFGAVPVVKTVSVLPGVTCEIVPVSEQLPLRSTLSRSMRTLLPSQVANLP